MSESQEQWTEQPGDGWPLPSPDVLRELDPPAPAWSEPEWPVIALPSLGRS